MFGFTLKNERDQLILQNMTYGAANFRTHTDDALYFSILDKYVELGGNCIDTARVYCEWLKGGRDSSESAVGRWLEARRNRDKMIIATKGGHYDLNDPHRKPRLDRDSLTGDLNRSLECLRTDYADIYFLHRDDINVPIGEIMSVLDGFVKSGKVRFLGASNWTAARIDEANRWAAEHGAEPFRVSQIFFSLAYADKMGDPTLVPMTKSEYGWYESNNFPVMAFSSQAKGFFARWAKSSADPDAGVEFYSDINVGRLAKVRNLSDKTGLSPAVIPFGYLNSQKFFVSSVFSASSVEHIEEDMKAQDLRFDGETLKFLESV